MVKVGSYIDYYGHQLQYLKRKEKIKCHHQMFSVDII